MRYLTPWFAVAITILCPAGGWADTFKLVTLEYPPYEYSENGEVKGLAVEVVRAAFKLMQHDVQIESYPWARSQKMFERGDADGIFTYFKTPSREVFALFGQEAVTTQTISLWALKTSNIAFNGDLTRLQSHSFCVVNQTSYGERFDAAVKYELLRTDSASTAESCVKKLLAGRTDMWVSNRLGAEQLLKRLGQRDAVVELKQPLQEVSAFVGFSRLRNHTALRDAFDQALATLKESGAYDALVKKYSE